MTSFAIYGLNGHELMSFEKVFKRPVVENVGVIAAERPIDEMEHRVPPEQHDRRHLAEQAYSTVEQLPQSSTILLAEQVMSSPVAILTPQARISEALRQFQTKAFRHIPVVSSASGLVGIVSDRDILRYLAGLTESYRHQVAHPNDARVEQLMMPQVLTASVDTDVRYIARLFVEQHIGAMPVVKDGELKGIITRSDLLGVIIRHYALELWA